MNTYLIEFFTTSGMNHFGIVNSKSDGRAQDFAWEMDELPGRIPNQFEIYRLLRNSDNQLYLADCDCDPISSN